MASDGGPVDHYTARKMRTESHIVTAATELFLAHGYAATSLVAVARRAAVSERTLYLHFASKVVLFQRVVEVGILGDVGPQSMSEREWSLAALGAPTLAARIEAFADGVALMTERLAPLMAVNAEVENREESVRASAERWRHATLDYLRAFWGGLARDGLLPAGADVEWLSSTSAILSAAETRLLISRTLAWDRHGYRLWLIRTWTALARLS